MAKPKSEPTPAMKAHDAAKAAYDAAKEKHAKVANDVNKKALEAAGEKLSAAAKVVNRERFEGVAGGRVGKALQAISSLKNCSNRRSYEYDASDVTTAFTALETALKDARAEFDKALASSTGEKKSAGPTKFTFGK